MERSRDPETETMVPAVLSLTGTRSAAGGAVDRDADGGERV